MNTIDPTKMFEEPIFIGLASELSEELVEVDLEKLFEEEEKLKTEAEAKAKKEKE